MTKIQTETKSLKAFEEFNPAAAAFPSTPYMFNYPNLHNELNYVCPHCNSMLWKEERKHRLNCCNNGKYTKPASKPVPPAVMNTFTSKKFQRAQRGYNGLFSFTAWGAGGVDKRSWTQLNRGASMLTLHGKAYHRIFDLQQQYEDMNERKHCRYTPHSHPREFWMGTRLSFSCRFSFK